MVKVMVIPGLFFVGYTKFSTAFLFFIKTQNLNPKSCN